MPDENIAEAGHFSAIPNKPGSAFKYDAYPPIAGSIAVLKGFLREYGISKYQLAKMLGQAEPRTVFQWFDGTRRPAALFLTRLMWLMLKANDGLDLKQIRSIDWNTGRITWRPSGEGPAQVFEGQEAPKRPKSWGFNRELVVRPETSYEGGQNGQVQ